MGLLCRTHALEGCSTRTGRAERVCPGLKERLGRYVCKGAEGHQNADAQRGERPREVKVDEKGRAKACPPTMPTGGERMSRGLFARRVLGLFLFFLRSWEASLWSKNWDTPRIEQAQREAVGGAGLSKPAPGCFRKESARPIFWIRTKGAAPCVRFAT